MTERLADDLLKGAAAAADYLGLNRRQVYRMTESGELPVIRKAGLLFYRKSELEKVFASDESPPPVYRACAAKRAPKRASKKPAVPPGTIKFADLIPIIMRAGDVPSCDFTKASANVKYLQRTAGIGFSGSGQGRAAHYRREDVLRILFACELQHFGLTAGQIASYMADEFPAFMSAVATKEPLKIKRHFAGRTGILLVDVPGLVERLDEIPAAAEIMRTGHPGVTVDTQSSAD